MHLSRMIPLPRARRWEAEWNGHRIAVENGLRERLLVDGQVVAESAPGVHVDARLCAQVLDAGRVHHVSARVAAIGGGPRMGCHIFVGGVLIGGDINDRLVAPGHKAEPEALKSIEEQKRAAWAEFVANLLIFTALFAWLTLPLTPRHPVGASLLTALFASAYLVGPTHRLWKVSRRANKVR